MCSSVCKTAHVRRCVLASRKTNRGALWALLGAHASLQSRIRLPTVKRLSRERKQRTTVETLSTQWRAAHMGGEGFQALKHASWDALISVSACPPGSASPLVCSPSRMALSVSGSGSRHWLPAVVKRRTMRKGLYFTASDAGVRACSCQMAFGIVGLRATIMRSIRALKVNNCEPLTCCSGQNGSGILWIALNTSISGYRRRVDVTWGPQPRMKTSTWTFCRGEM